MANIQDAVARLFPEVEIVQGETLELNVPDAKWHSLAAVLKQELGFDNLTALIGMDWGELLGVVYYLTNTATNEIIGKSHYGQPQGPDAAFIDRPVCSGRYL